MIKFVADYDNDISVESNETFNSETINNSDILTVSFFVEGVSKDYLLNQFPKFEIKLTQTTLLPVIIDSNKQK